MLGTQIPLKMGKLCAPKAVLLLCMLHRYSVRGNVHANAQRVVWSARRRGVTGRAMVWLGAWLMAVAVSAGAGRYGMANSSAELAGASLYLLMVYPVVFEVAPGHPWHRAGEVVRDMSPCF